MELTTRRNDGKTYDMRNYAHGAALQPEKPLLSDYEPSTAPNYAEDERKSGGNGPYSQVSAIFRTFLRSTNHMGWKTAKILNNGLHRTAHKLPHLHRIAMITPIAPTHYFLCALSGEP